MGPFKWWNDLLYVNIFSENNIKKCFWFTFDWLHVRPFEEKGTEQFPGKNCFIIKFIVHLSYVPYTLEIEIQMYEPTP